MQPRWGAPYWIPDVLVRDVTCEEGVRLHLGHVSVRRYKEIRPETGMQAVFGSTRVLCCGAAVASIVLMFLMLL